MIILLNQDSIRFETLSACQARIAMSLGLKPSWVKLELVRATNGNLVPDIKFNVPDGLKTDEKRGKYFTESNAWIREHVGQLVHIAMREFRIRCEGAGCL